MKGKNIFWGIFFICAAAFVVLNQLGHLTDIGLPSLIFTILLVPVFVKSLFKLNFFGIFFSSALLAIIYATPLGITSFVPWHILLVALLLSIGFSIIFGSRKKIYTGQTSCCADATVATVDGSEIYFKESFGSSSKYINSDNLKNVHAKCSFGAMAIYFSNTTLDSNGATLTLDCSFCGVEIYVPHSWRVINHVNTTLGAVDEKHANIDHNGPVLIINGNASFSGIEIRNL